MRFVAFIALVCLAAIASAQGPGVAAAGGGAVPGSKLKNTCIRIQSNYPFKYITESTTRVWSFSIKPSSTCCSVPNLIFTLFISDTVLTHTTNGIGDDYIVIDVPKPAVHYYAAEAHEQEAPAATKG
jgi:hypothetical protein